MPDAPSPTSFWLVPAEPARTMLRAHIDALAARLGTPAFDPHITLASAVVDDASAAAALSPVAAATAPMDLRAGPTAHGPDRFRAVVVMFADARIHRLAAEVSAALDIPFDPDQLVAHVSLVYADALPVGVRTAVATANTFEGSMLSFDTVVANRSTGDRDDVARWHTFAVEPLRGSVGS